MIKWNKKKIGVILAVCLMASNNVYAAPESSQSTIDTLLASTNPHDHIEALKIMEANGAKITKITINEFDALKALNEKLEDGKDERAQVYSAEELDYISNYRANLTKKIENMQQQSDETLKKYDYTDDQIYAIRNFDGSDEMLRRASSECNVYGGFNNFTTSSSRSSAQLVAAFDWNGAYSPGNPVANSDIFGVTWAAPYRENSATGYLIHENVSYNSTIQTTVTVDADDLYVSSIQVDNNKLKTISGTPIGHWIDAGSIISELSSNSYAPDLAGFAAYGLSSLSISPSVEAGSGGAGASLSFSSGVSEVGSSRFYPE